MLQGPILWICASLLEMEMNCSCIIDEIDLYFLINPKIFNAHQCTHYRYIIHISHPSAISLQMLVIVRHGSLLWKYYYKRHYSLNYYNRHLTDSYLQFVRDLI